VGNGNGAFNRPNTPTNHTHATDASRASDAHRPHGSIRVRRAQGGRVDLGLLRSYVHVEDVSACFSGVRYSIKNRRTAFYSGWDSPLGPWRV
jgi:hypothetical protein